MLSPELTPREWHSTRDAAASVRFSENTGPLNECVVSAGLSSEEIVRYRAMRSKSSGFSLVELLVVMGIIMVLVALLLPTLKKAKDNANRVACLNNLRQLGMGFRMYNQANDGASPTSACANQYEDFIYWEAGRNLNQGRLVAYTSSSGLFDPRLYTCPSDDPLSHVRGFPYSYSVNMYVCSSSATISIAKAIHVTAIRHPSNCIVMVEESSQTIDDGCWAWQYQYGQGYNVTSTRHDSQYQEITSDPQSVTAGHTNVLFADGHSDWIPRIDTFNPVYFDPTQ